MPGLLRLHSRANRDRGAGMSINMKRAPTDSEARAVADAIAIHEGDRQEGRHNCTNDTIVEATGLEPEVVAAVLEELWQEGRIEGLLVVGGVKPYLRGIVRVLPGQSRVWERDGRFVRQPG